MEEYAADVVSNQRKPQFGGMKKESAAAMGNPVSVSRGPA